ncbi:Type-1 restriction enzyme EcoKI specificity protein [Candidatus Brocadiaceae bacterium B188]|nr:Type-1 restriction enzyme EcoKI specificity protein [Candidatus Brocadiaceae bacterium B188]
MFYRWLPPKKVVQMIDKSKLPPSWEVVKLGEVCEIFQGYGFPIIMQRKSKGKFPFYKVGDISRNVLSGNQYLEYCENYIDDEELQKLKAKPYPKKTIVFAKIGEALKLNRRALTKYPCIVDNNAVGLKAVEIICSDLFLFFFLKLIKLEKYSRATTVPSVRKSEIKAIEIPLPPLPEQHRIVSKTEELFSELDKGVESLKTARQQLKIYRQAVLKWAFEGKLTHENVKDGELPEGWKWVKISEICNVVRGGSPRPAGNPKFYGGNIPFLKVADLTKDNNIYIDTFGFTIKEAGLQKTRKISPNTLLLTNSGATLGVPKICMIEATINDGIAAFLNLDKRSNLFLYYFWMSKTKELRTINQGAAQPNLNTEIINNYDLPYCPFEEQIKIISEIETRLSVCDKLEETITTALQQSDALRQSILKKAFEGRLVEQNPNDKPASKLLERIRAEKAAEQRHVYRKKIKQPQ